MSEVGDEPFHFLFFGGIKNKMVEEAKRFGGKIEKVGTVDKVLSFEEIKAIHELLGRKEIEGFKWINNKLYIFEKERHETGREHAIEE